MASKLVQFGELLTLTDAPRGKYTLSFNLSTPDPQDQLTLIRSRGTLSALINGQWQSITDSLNLSSATLLKVTSPAQFFLTPHEGGNPSSPNCRFADFFSLNGLKSNWGERDKSGLRTGRAEKL